MNPQPLTLQLTADQTVTPAGAPAQRILEIAIQAAEREQTAPRPAINLALVLDRSGSMRGSKLDFVKQAARYVVDLLSPTDRLALVDYDDDVRLLVHSAPADEGQRQLLRQAILGIQSGGMTNLSGGWLAGCQQVAESMQAGGVNRALLLTDGLANAGITEPEALQGHARALAQRGVATSTFGVGSGFNHHLLEAMANQGEGQFYFIECPEDIPNIFSQELGELCQTAASNLEITLSYPASWEIYVPGDWQMSGSQPGQLRLRAGSLGAGRSKEIYARFMLPAGPQTGEQPPAALTASLMATDPQGRLLESQAALEITYASPAEAEAAPKNTLLLERFARVDLAHQASESLKLEQQGQREHASRAMREKMREHQAYSPPSLMQEYQGLSHKMQMGMDELERKRAHASSHHRKRRLMEAAHYTLLNHTGGHLVIDVNRHHILIDTGSPVSIGDRSHWEFLGYSIPLKRNFMGVTTTYLSKVIGERIDMLLGMDVLKEFYMLVRKRQGLVWFNHEPFHDGIGRRMEFLAGVPHAAFEVAGQERRLFIDSSAKLSYLSRQAVAGLEPVDSERDFYPGVGEFDTQVYQLPLKVENWTVPLRFGVLPPMLEASLLVSGMEGILGTELYATFDAYMGFREEWLDLIYPPEY